MALGYPTGESIEKAQRGELILGGCEISGPTYPRLCPKCDEELADEAGGEAAADESEL